MPEVRTTTGAVRGTTDADIAVFKDIPFAQPPVGALRFTTPQPAHRWDGVREALSYGPPPPQRGRLPGSPVPQDLAGPHIPRPAPAR
ncbi:carboxylesterase family protein [Saccharothrix sp.]|uniref:carboxylesterase family protein n=1 Tax=Saccharothrix sp. TaxID=1873460 RepID=UPI002811994F|nr:carboxylesterase family protein [Saccharothrix sp.]